MIPWGSSKVDRLTVLRDLRGFTQAELAQVLSLFCFLSHVEKGSRPLPGSVGLFTQAPRARCPSLSFEPTPALRGWVCSPSAQEGQCPRQRRAASHRALHRGSAPLPRCIFSVRLPNPEQPPDPANFERDPEACAVTLREDPPGRPPTSR